MLTGLTQPYPYETTPWGGLCLAEQWPVAHFEPPARIDQVAAAGLLPWSIRFRHGLHSKIVGWMDPMAYRVVDPIGIVDRCQDRIDKAQSVLSVAASDLALLEQTLQKSRFGRGWRNERFSLRDRTGGLLVDETVEGALILERSLFRSLGLLSCSVQLNVTTPDGKIWIGQRSLGKHIDPGLWDAAVAGGLSAGESPLAAVRREAWEEAGLDRHWWPQIRFLGRVRICRLLSDCLHHEQVWVYGLCVGATTSLAPQDGEVMGFEVVTPQEILRRYREGQFNHEAACASFIGPQ